MVLLYQCPFGLVLLFYGIVFDSETGEYHVSMPSRAGAPFLQSKWRTNLSNYTYVSMPSRVGASFLPARIMIPITWKELSINALSGWGFISTVPLQKPRFYAVSGACFCRYLSEYSDNDHFPCMLTIWIYLIATSTT